MGALKNFNPFDIFNLFGGGWVGGLSRYFTELAAAFSQYYTIPTVTLTGDFEIESEVVTTFTTTQIIVGHSSDVLSWLSTQGTGKVKARINGSTVESVAIVNDGKLHTIRLARVSGTTTLYVDDVADGTVVQAGNVLLDRIGSYNGGAFFDGIIAELKTWDAGTLVRRYKLDEDMVSATIADSSGNGQDGTRVNITSADAEKFTFNTADNAWIGQERVDLSSWTYPAGYTLNGNEIDISGAADYSSCYDTSGVLNQGDTYKSSQTFNGADQLRLRVGNTNSPINTGSGTFTYTQAAADNGSIRLQVSAPAAVGTVSNVSIKRALEIA